MIIPVCLLLAVLPAATQEPVARYRVEQVFRLESVSAAEVPAPGRLQTEPVATTFEGRMRLIVEQTLESEGVRWRFAEVEFDPPHTEPPEQADPSIERVLRMALTWMKQQEGREFSGAVSELPALPLGESAPAWLTDWLRWAQTGGFSGVEGDPAQLTQTAAGSSTPVSYRLDWLRSESRRVPCHVQQARWAIPVAPAAESVSPQLAAEGVEARTHFAAQSLEWVSQENPTLIYAERSGVRETFWTLEKVEKPELKQLVFRLRLSVEVRIERLP